MSITIKARSGVLEHLRQEREANPQLPSKVPSKLCLSAIHVEPLAFQVRADGLLEDRVAEIARGVDGSILDEPIHVWWSGKRWIVVEGHHRRAAYLLKQERAGKTFKVPVVAHPDLTLEEALGIAGRLNNREKIKISKADMLDNAWRMVCMGAGSIAQQSERSGVSKGTIDNMRSVKKALLDRRRPIEHMIDVGWAKCREWVNGKSHRDHSPDALEEMAEEMAEELRKIKVTTIKKSPDVFARAIEKVSPELPSRLLESDPFWGALNTNGRTMLEEADAEESQEGTGRSDAIEDF